MTKIIGSMATVIDARGAAKPFVLQDDYGLPELTATRDAFEAMSADHAVLTSALRQANGARNQLRHEVVGWMFEFSQRARGFKQHPVFAQACEALRTDIKYSSSLDKIDEAAAVAIQEWQKIDDVVAPAIPHPFLLSNGVTREQFTTAVGALKASGVAVIMAQGAVRDSAATRRKFVNETIRPRAVEYRKLVKALYPSNHIFVVNLPRVYPPAGSTPDAVTLRGGWDVTGQIAALSWTACKHADLQAYEIRVCLDTTYNAEEDEVVARVSKETLHYTTAYGLADHEDRAVFRIYAITKTGRERGSNSLLVIRPMALPVAV
ncbi:MAG: hypothetical protein SFY80_06430 [Verrucomicrobiota bacterium]|nr:hypothetical protein [Verrucomicrobiota bacterium]